MLVRVFCQDQMVLEFMTDLPADECKKRLQQDTSAWIEFPSANHAAIPVSSAVKRTAIVGYAIIPETTIQPVRPSLVQPH